ncbi:MAG: TlpA family protein disulfide reductase [Betaproteobacteria bacterium]|nr:TlpA family protein disulfide reductase [Betaproteobacteria bacterium]
MLGKRVGTALAAILVAAVTLLLFAIFTPTAAAPQVTFVSLKGEKTTTAGLRGKVVLVNFWATDCPVCLKEMPDMVRAYERYRDRGFEFIAVAMRYDPPNYVVAYAEENRLPFTVALDPMGELAQAFGGVKLTPTTFVIDKRGNIVLRVSGGPDFARLTALLEEKLNEAI